MSVPSALLTIPLKISKQVKIHNQWTFMKDSEYMKEESYDATVSGLYRYQKYRVKLQGKFRREDILRDIQEKKKMVDFCDSSFSIVYKHDYLQYDFRRKVRIAYCSESNLRVYYTVDFRGYLLYMWSIHIRRIGPSRACMVVRCVRSELWSSREDVSENGEEEIWVHKEKIYWLKNYILPSFSQAYSHEVKWACVYRDWHISGEKNQKNHSYDSPVRWYQVYISLFNTVSKYVSMIYVVWNSTDKLYIS